MARISLGFMQLAVIVGFSAYYAWCLVVFFGLFAFPLTGLDVAELHCGQLVLFAADVVTMTCILAAFRRAGSVRFGHMRFLHLANLVLGSALPAVFVADALGMSVGMPAFYGACVLAGISLAVGFVLWDDLSVHGCLERDVLAHGVVFCAGGVLFIVCILLPVPLATGVLCELFLCASTALLAFVAPCCGTLGDGPARPIGEYFRFGRADARDDARLRAEVARRYRLSPRESEVLVYVLRGRNAKHVAEKLYISESTAKTHISNIYRKMGVHSQQELLDKADDL